MWSFEHTVECRVSRDFAWQFWTNVDNWAVVDPGVESVKLDGPFAVGSRGATKTGDQPPIEWQITEVEEGKRALIEVAVPGAVAKFLWMFADTASGTRLTQQASIEGEQTDHYYAENFGKEMESGMPAGMQRLADAIEAAGSSSA